MATIMSDQVERFRSSMTTWVREVGRYQLAMFRSEFLAVGQKASAHDPVTEVDQWSERYLRQKITESFPEHQITGEEYGETSNSKNARARWIIDPLDGTVNYARGLPFFTISVALEWGGDVVLGVVYAPVLDEMYVAVKGQGATRNGVPIHVSRCDDLSYALLSTGFPYDKDRHPINNVDNVARLVPQIASFRRIGSAALDLCLVAAGHVDGYWELNLKEWDCAAGILMVSEAGGVVEPFRDDRGMSIVASNKGIFSALRSQLR